MCVGDVVMCAERGFAEVTRVLGCVLQYRVVTLYCTMYIAMQRKYGNIEQHIAMCRCIAMQREALVR